MKASELNLGDLIQCYNRYEKVSELVNTHPALSNPYKISTEFVGGFFHRKEEEVKPIPLTAEILEKNGFKQDTIGSGLILHITGAENLYVLVNFRHNGECRNVEISNGMYNLSLPVRYVHNLQHALRVCGLSEMADNIEVKR